MSYLVLARKYRPQRFEEVVGQTHVTRTLTHAIEADRVAHALLFSGPRGTGKTTVARILAKALNCAQGPAPVPCNDCTSCRSITQGHSVDVFEIDGASNNSVEQIRELRENVRYMPAQSRLKIYIIDEVHMLSLSAFNALLKTLEEPPDHVMFMFATTEPHKIPITILSRCQRHDFRRIDGESITALLGVVCGREQVEADADALRLIALEAGGSIRDALSLLDQVMAGIDAALTADQVPEILGLVDRKTIHEMSSAILNRDVGAILERIDDVYNRGLNLKKLYADLLAHFRNLLVVKLGKDPGRLVDLPAMELEEMQQQAEDHPAVFLNQIFDLLLKEESGMRFTAQPRLLLEMLLIRLAQVPPAIAIDDLIGKLDRLRTEMAHDAPPPTGETSGGAQGGPGPAPGPAKENPETSPPRKANGFRNDPDGLWDRLIEGISADHPALATSLQQGGRLCRLGDKRVEVEMQGNGFSLNLVQRRKNRDILHRTLEELLGMKVEVAFRTTPVCENATHRQRNEELKKEALHHPLVADAVEIFDGKIVDVKLSQEVCE